MFRKNVIRISLSVMALVTATTVAHAYNKYIRTNPPCADFYVDSAFRGQWSCHDARHLAWPPTFYENDTISIPIPTRPWYDTSDEGFQNKHYTSATCNWTSAKKDRMCQTYNDIWPLVPVTITTEEPAYRLDNTPPSD